MIYRALRAVLGFGLYAAACLIVCLAAVEFYLQKNDDAYRRLLYWNYDPPIYAPSETMPYTLRPNVHTVHFRRGEFSVHVHTNAQGLREDREIAIPKPAGTSRVLVIGDSFAFGYGVERHEAFQAVSERLLDATGGGRHFEIVNMGFASGGSLDARYVYMRDEAPKYQPDAIVVVFFYSADLGRVYQNRPHSDYDERGLPRVVRYLPEVIDPNTGFRMPRYEFETSKGASLFFPDKYPVETAEAPGLVAALARSANALRAADVKSSCRHLRLCQVTYRYLQIRLLSGRNSGAFEASLVTLPSAPQQVGSNLLDYDGETADGFPAGSADHPAVAQEGWTIAKRIFAGMKQLADDRDVKFGVLFVPSEILVDYDPRKGKADPLARFFRTDEMERAQKVNKPDRVFGGWLRSAGIDYLDPAIPMRADREKLGRPFYFEYDRHWNVDGQASLGRHFADWIARLANQPTDLSSRK